MQKSEARRSSSSLSAEDSLVELRRPWLAAGLYRCSASSGRMAADSIPPGLRALWEAVSAATRKPCGACYASMAISSHQVVHPRRQRGSVRAAAAKDQIAFLALSLGSSM